MKAPLPPLTEEQQAVVDAQEGRIAVCACPGSGKTRTVVDRFLMRTRTASSRRGIAVLSFSRVAAKEIRNRCRQEGLDQLLCFPHFVGTLDGFVGRFIFRPVMQASSRRPVDTVESWDAIDAVVHVAGVRSQGVPLSAFLPDIERVRLEKTRIGAAMQGLLKAAIENPAPWERSASKYIERLNHKGLYSSEQVRFEALRILKNQDYSQNLCQILASRFEEIIIDEAQDCDEAQIALIESLSRFGVRRVFVADPEQAIFEFRQARPELLTHTTRNDKRLELTGNRRSTPAICKLANSMRGTSYTPMVPTGDLRESRIPILILPFPGKTAEGAEAAFRLAAQAVGVLPGDVLLVAHSRSLAFRTAGFGDADDQKVLPAVKLVNAAVGVMSGLLPGPDRQKALTLAEETLLRRLGLPKSDTQTSTLCKDAGIQPRWLKAAAFGLLRKLDLRAYAQEKATTGEAFTWVREELQSISPPGEMTWKLSVRQMFPSRSAEEEKPIVLPGRGKSQSAETTTFVSTIHGVKGSEKDSVLVVLSPTRVDELMTAWEQRRDVEAKRVAYVAMTRAKQLLGIAIPSRATDRLLRILKEHKVDHQVHSVSPISGKAPGTRSGGGKK